MFGFFGLLDLVFISTDIGWFVHTKISGFKTFIYQGSMKRGFFPVKMGETGVHVFTENADN